MEDHGREPRNISFDDDIDAGGETKVRYFMLKGSPVEVLARVETHPSQYAGTTIRLHSPMQILVQQGATGEGDLQSLTLNEWIPFLDQSFVDIPRDQILTQAGVKREIETFYDKIVAKFAALDEDSHFAPPPKGLVDLAALDPTAPDFLEKFGKIMDTMDEKSKNKLKAGTSRLEEILGVQPETPEDKRSKADKAIDELAEAMGGKKPTIH